MNDKNKDIKSQHIKQPLTAKEYLFVTAAWVIIVCLLLFVFALSAGYLQRQGILERFYFVILVFLGLLSAGFLFGVMRSYAYLKAKQIPAVFEGGGPVAGALIVIFVGIFLVPKDKLEFHVIVRYYGPSGRSECPELPNGTEIKLDLENDVRREKIVSDKCLAEFKNLPKKFLNHPLQVEILGLNKVGFEQTATTYEILDPLDPIVHIELRRKAMPLRTLEIIWKNSPFAYEGSFEVDYRKTGTVLEIMLKKTEIRLRSDLGYKGSRNVRSLRAALAIDKEGTWKAERFSSKHKMNRTMSPGESFSLESVNFEIALGDLKDLSEYWLVFELEDEIEGQGAGSYFAHSDRGIFT